LEQLDDEDPLPEADGAELFDDPHPEVRNANATTNQPSRIRRTPRRYQRRSGFDP
jgi:hypothetical protein